MRYLIANLANPNVVMTTMLTLHLSTYRLTDSESLRFSEHHPIATNCSTRFVQTCACRIDHPKLADLLSALEQGMDPARSPKAAVRTGNDKRSAAIRRLPNPESRIIARDDQQVRGCSESLLVVMRK